MIEMTVDARGLNCPLPILRARKAIGGIPIGSTLEVLTTDPGSLADFAAFARQTGQELVASEKNDDHFRFILRRNT